MVGALICFVIGLVLFWTALRRHHKIRKIEDSVSSKLATASQGLIKAEGFAWPLNNTVKNLEGIDAVYYYTELQRQVYEKAGHSRNRYRVKTWKTVVKGTFAHPFLLLDPTGLAVIDAKEAEMEVPVARRRNWRSLSQKEKDQYARTLDLKIPGFPPPNGIIGFLFGSKFRVIEKEILSGSPVYASGDFRTLTQQNETVSDAALHMFANRVIDFDKRAVKDVRHLLSATGKTEVSAEEATRGYSMVARMAQLKAKQNPSLPIRPLEVFGHVSASPAHGLFVADVHGEHLLERLHGYQKLRLVGGAALMAIAIVWGLHPGGGGGSKARVPASQTRGPDWYAIDRDCKRGAGQACDLILRNAQPLRLSKEQLTFYKAKACASGARQYCQ
jgi:hypothetical protein